MTRGRAYYVQAVQHAFPHGVRLESGPFESLRECMAECARLAPLYPDAHLREHVKRAKSLPTLTPRRAGLEPLPDTGYDLRKRPERERAAADIAARAEALGATVVIENWDGEPDVDITLPSLRATIWLAHLKAAPMPTISWYGAQYPLRAVPGAWTDADVNSAHGRKATSLPATWPELFDMLEAGICAAIDGSAFDL